MTTATLTLPTALTLALATAACATEETDPSVEVRSTTLPLNSPRMNDYDVPELNLDGEANFDDVTVLGVRDQNNDFYALGVSGDHRLTALNAQGDSVLSGNQMIGTKIELSTPLGTKVLRVFDYEATVLSWADPGEYVSTYALAYQDATSGRWINVCPEYFDNPYAKVVTIIADERYDYEHKEVILDQWGWITLACEGQAVYKMKFLGYGPNMMFNGGPGGSTEDQRNATLKMITATYCAFDGDYTSYTLQNTAIRWANFDGTVDTFEEGADVEAKWGPDGALCLEHKRLATSLPTCAQELPDCDQITSWEWQTWVP